MAVAEFRAGQLELQGNQGVASSLTCRAKALQRVLALDAMSERL